MRNVTNSKTPFTSAIMAVAALAMGALAMAGGVWKMWESTPDSMTQPVRWAWYVVMVVVGLSFFLAGWYDLKRRVAGRAKNSACHLAGDSE